MLCSIGIVQKALRKYNKNSGELQNYYSKNAAVFSTVFCILF